MRQQHVGRTFHKEHMRVVVGMVDYQHRHHLALRGEGNLADALEALLAVGCGIALLSLGQLQFGDQERGFGRVTLNGP